MGMTALAKKLRLQDAERALILNAPQGYLEALGEVTATIEAVSKSSGEFDVAHLFVMNAEELERDISRVLRVTEHVAILWISYPKGSSGVDTDLHRDKLWKALEDKGIRPVSQVPVDEVWSAMRLRPTEAVGR